MQKAHLVIPSRALLHLRLNVKKEFVSNKLFFPLLYHPFNHNSQLTVSYLRLPLIPTLLTYVSRTARTNKTSYNRESPIDCGDCRRAAFGAMWKVGLGLAFPVCDTIDVWWYYFCSNNLSNCVITSNKITIC